MSVTTGAASTANGKMYTESCWSTRLFGTCVNSSDARTIVVESTMCDGHVEAQIRPPRRHPADGEQRRRVSSSGP